MLHQGKTTQDRFWSYVRKTDGCWLWQGGKNGLKPYGRFWDGDKRKLVGAHRYSFELAFGILPADLHVDHLCKNEACVRPDHLDAVSPGENIRRGNLPLGLKLCKLYCAKDHPLFGPNLYLTPKHLRICRICALDRARAYRQKKAHDLREQAVLSKTYRRPRPEHKEYMCPAGHLVSGDNLLLRAGGKRRCRACDNAQSKRSYRKRRASQT